MDKKEAGGVHFCSNGFDVSSAHDCDEAVSLTFKRGNCLWLMDVHNCKAIVLRTFRSSSLSTPHPTPYSFAGITGSTT
jgi:hypothetical protein